MNVKNANSRRRKKKKNVEYSWRISRNLLLFITSQSDILPFQVIHLLFQLLDFF